MYGFLGMGGASTQLGFVHSEVEHEQHCNNLAEVMMMSEKEIHHKVVTTSLGHGQIRAVQLEDAVLRWAPRWAPSCPRVQLECVINRLSSG